MLTAIVGINWGDEGKGRMVDLLSRDQQIVVRYQGDHSSEHTIVNENGRYVLNLLPAGILRSDVICVMGGGMAIDPVHLEKEIQALYDMGVCVSPENLRISDRAPVILPFHTDIDQPSGVSLVYGDKTVNMAIRMGDLLSPDYLKARLEKIVAYHAEHLRTDLMLSYEEVLNFAIHYGEVFRDYICDTGRFLTEAHKQGMNILFEAPQGALRDVDFGIYPYTCSSSTVAAYATIGAGIPGLKLDKTIGVLKSFSSMAGDGPFVSELLGEEASHLMERENEASEKVLHPHRIGAFDAVASRYGVTVQGADELALTKLDTLSYMSKIPVCVAYDVHGIRTETFPSGADLTIAKPIFEYVDGWNLDISECRTADDLPVGALTYVKYLEHLVGCKISYVSVGAEREAYIKL
jgi:adenylosuccinate synthase